MPELPTLATFALFGRELEKGDPVFWFMMQLAMLGGFLTSKAACDRDLRRRRLFRSTLIKE